METINAVFIGSYTDWQKCPQENKPAYAFIGRSNVGKSSIVNMLCDKKDLAKISQTPGKTQTINFFLVNDLWYLVDLPGYGYARTSKKVKNTWPAMIQAYLKESPTLECVFVLIDASISPQKIDLEFINKLGTWQLPFVILFTKADKASALEVAKNKKAFFEKLAETWNEMPFSITTSSRRKYGKTEVLEFIADINGDFYKKILP